jgi:hypothetical protein
LNNHLTIGAEWHQDDLSNDLFKFQEAALEDLDQSVEEDEDLRLLEVTFEV